MTLRQKVLAKQSKKGFTLVELVVVIAILAILAAIAIPAVVGIIDNAQKSAKRSNASELDAAAKKLYAGVKQARSTAVHLTTNSAVLLPTRLLFSLLQLIQQLQREQRLMLLQFRTLSIMQVLQQHLQKRT